MIRAVSLFAFIIGLLIATPATAQQGCDAYVKIAMNLNMMYGESRHSQWLAPHSIFELWANEEKRTWTLLQIYPGGRACLKTAGEGYAEFEPMPPGQDL